MNHEKIHPGSGLGNASAQPLTPADSASAAAVFDVDGTFCATQSINSLIWLRGRQQPGWRHRLWLIGLAWRAPLLWLADLVNRNLADRMIYRQFGGVSLSHAQRDAVKLCEDLLFPSCFPKALAELEMHRAAGRRLILLSGGVDLVLAPLARKLGAELLAQRVVTNGDRMTGEYRTYEILENDCETGVSSQAKTKCAALTRYAARTGIDLSASFAYGDSINDSEMLAATGHPVAVNPDPRLKRIAEQRGWEIRSW